jgi:flagellin-like hook-associated protein FlgL
VLPGALPPALLAEDGHGYAAILGDTRERAALIAGDLDRLDEAGDGLARVRRLVGRLHDVAVVATDVRLQPAQRAALQRQVDLNLSAIDTIANDTQVDEALLRGGRSASGPDGASGAGGTAGSQSMPYRAIGTAKLGLAGLAVRSADQAVAASEALDRATSRLNRSGRALDNAAARLKDALQKLTNPSTTVAGEPALAGETSAFSSMVMLRSSLLANQGQAVQAQTDLEAPRVRWLLDAPPR